MSRTLAVALSLLCLAALPALADTGEVGFDIASLRIGEGSDQALKLRGGWFIPGSNIEIGGQIGRTLGHSYDMTTALGGPTFILSLHRKPAESVRGGVLTVSPLVGVAHVDDAGLSETGLAWQVAFGSLWLGEVANFRLEAGWQSTEIAGETLDGAFVGAGVSFRMGD